jgi:Fur family transcriptional regulator, zinc uptake regulator
MSNRLEHDHSACVRDALASAGRVCAETGARLTPLRRRALELIWSSHRAVKAYELLEGLGGVGRRAMPPTVYRALDFLMQHGLVHRIDSLNAFVGCACPGERHAAHLLICNGCGTVEEMAGSAIGQAIRAAAGEAGFKVTRETVEVQGRCAQCQASPQ